MQRFDKMQQAGDHTKADRVDARLPDGFATPQIDSEKQTCCRSVTPECSLFQKSSQMANPAIANRPTVEVNDHANVFAIADSALLSGESFFFQYGVVRTRNNVASDKCCPEAQRSTEGAETVEQD